MDPRNFKAFKRQAGRVRVPYLRDGEPEALLRIEHVRRQAEEQADQARLEVELAQHAAMFDAGIEPPPPAFETTLGGFTNQQF